MIVGCGQVGVGSLSCTKRKADSRPRAAAGLEVSGGLTIYPPPGLHAVCQSWTSCA